MYSGALTDRAVTFLYILLADLIANTDKNLQSKASLTYMIIFKCKLLLWRFDVNLLLQILKIIFMSASELAFTLNAQN